MHITYNVFNAASVKIEKNRAICVSKCKGKIDDIAYFVFIRLNVINLKCFSKNFDKC